MDRAATKFGAENKSSTDLACALGFVYFAYCQYLRSMFRSVIHQHTRNHGVFEALGTGSKLGEPGLLVSYDHTYICDVVPNIRYRVFSGLGSLYV